MMTKTGKIVADVNSLENFYVRAVAPPFSALLMAISMALFMGRFSGLLALAWVAIWLALAAVLPALALQMSRRPGREQVAVRSELVTTVIDGLQGMADLQAFGAYGRLAGQVERHSLSLARAQSRLAWISGLQNAVGGFLANLGAWTVLVAAIPLVRANPLEGVTLAVLVLAVLASFKAVAPLPLAAQHLESSRVTARRLLSIVSLPAGINNPIHPAPLPRRFGLAVQDLRFRYPADILPVRDAAPPSDVVRTVNDPSFSALDGVTFSIPEGSRIALVGPSGCGKSTLLNLLLRFWDYQEGEIFFGGRDLRDYRDEDLRRQFSAVSQPPHLFNATVRENLLLARPQASQAELIQAAQAAQIHDLIEQLPQGYNTWIGEGGIRLSGGECQRLAIARALLKDAPSIFLDEPTANLDPITEQAVTQSILQLLKGRTIFLITHRLTSFVEFMDEILVMNKGRIIARGSHTRLLDQEGYYRQMWELQKPGL